MITKLFEMNDIKTINVVRNDDQIKTILEQGGVYQALNSENDMFEKNLKNCLDENPVIFFDAVGSELCGKIFNLLPSNSVTYSYGVQSHKVISGIDPAHLVFQQKQLKGFWLSKWIDSLTEEQFEEVKNITKSYIEKKIIHTQISQIFQSDDINQALIYYQQNQNKGKVLLCF